MEKKMQDIFDLCRSEDLPQDLQLIERACGLDTVKLFLRKFSGISFYIPKLTRFDTLIIKFIEVNKNKSLKEIASELNVSEQFLRTLIKREKQSKKYSEKSS